MSDNTIERKVSRGIGGAGNMRTPSEIVEVKRALDEGSPERIEKQRSNSVWSNSSTGSRRKSIIDMFRRGSKDEGIPDVENVEQKN
ncbi:hypothetical protein MBLNU457_4316t1 [Dothideomycetes sp. NU457]